MDRLTYLQCVNKDYQLALKQLNKRDLFEYCRAVLLCCPPCVIQDLRKCNLGRKRTTSKVWGTATAAKLASVSATMSRIASCGRPQDPPAGSSSASNIASGTYNELGAGPLRSACCWAALTVATCLPFRRHLLLSREQRLERFALNFVRGCKFRT